MYIVGCLYCLLFVIEVVPYAVLIRAVNGYPGVRVPVEQRVPEQ